MLAKVKQEIRALGKRENYFKPHKLIALLTAIESLKKNNFGDGRICFDSFFKETFASLFSQFSTDDSNSCRAHTPFFHLKTFPFWSLVPLHGKELELETTTTVGGPGALSDLVDHAVVLEPLLSLLKEESTREELVQLIVGCLQEGGSQNGHYSELSVKLPNRQSEATFNPFVSYLNSLQRSGGGNENALAESQVCNAQFAFIHVEHPLADIIYKELREPDGRHVLLTGHAGDGKSTLAMEVYKFFRGWDRDRPLEQPPRPREDTGEVSIIKDLSERDRNEDQSLLDELSKRERRFLLVSNTGTFLDLAKRHSEYFGENGVEIESRVLKAISSENGESPLTLGKITFRVFNLARMDNMPLARKIFEKMLAPERWALCHTLDCRKNCPVFTNVELLQANQERATERIFLAYRRMYEYGTRLTMRQFTEHLAYLITSGLNQQEIRRIQAQNPPQPVYEHLFFNRFFGDNGCQPPDGSALAMKAVQEIEAQKFGERPCPSWEHKLWLRNDKQPVTLGVDALNEEFETLRRHGAYELRSEEISSDQAREQVRRMLYFLADFPKEKQEYLEQYLNSPTLLAWERWQHDDLGSQEKLTLKRKVYHVLQEHFTGVRLPEGATQNERRLYVTLSRRRSEMRQSAQVVLADLDWEDSTTLELTVTKSATGEKRKDLVLRGENRIEGLEMLLQVPFLDYVMMRHFGELGEVLKASYLERLNRFKAQVQKKASTRDAERTTLVRLKTDHAFRRQRFALSGDKLVVNDD